MTERLFTQPNKLKRGAWALGLSGSLAISGCAAEQNAVPAANTAPAVQLTNDTQHEAMQLRKQIVKAEKAQAARNAELQARAILTPAPTPPPSPTEIPKPQPTHTRTYTPRPTSRHTEAPAVIAVPQNLSANARLAEQMAAARGWTGQEWVCLDELWSKESNFNALAHNPYSGADGIPQALPGDKMASAGTDWATNPVTQITWGLGYISGRYGTPCDAWSYHTIHNSY